jgi:tRNA A-37 threonylcarbamoyl transferase component Bud32
MYRSAGDLVMAGQAYEEAEDFDAAIQCYREANAIEMWINALERRGRTFEAAKLALDNEQRPRAIRLLQCIMPAEGDYAEASWLLAEAFEREGHFDLAAQKLEQHIATFTPGAAPSDKYARLAQQYEDSGSFERAMEVLQELRRREPTYPNVASRIEHLRKQRSAAERLERTTGSMTSGDAPTAFVSEYRYEILEEIGRGGMGVVFKARDRRLDRVVALKRLPEDLRRRHPKALQLFLREAQSAARLNHRNIVTVYDTDQEDGVFFITMELLDGQNFQQILKERGRLTAGEVVSVGLQVAAGLQYAHGRGIVHRDIKTANLFLTHDEIVKVMDFGLAKMFEEVRGATTIVSGTPFYMSPEQIVGGNVDQRTDLYSLGVTLFELATGRVPFEKGEVAYHHRHTSPPDPRDLQPDIPEELARILLDLLEKDIANRLHSADELIGRLEEIEGRIADRD